MIRIFPRLEDEKLLLLYKKGVEGQWSADEIDWDLPLKLHSEERVALARLLTPVYLGEQTAMVGASTVIPQFFSAHETEAQLYLATFLLDEARHFETITRFYQKLDQRPLEMRDLKEMFRYQARLLKSRDRVEWLWGILVSDIFARHFYSLHLKLFPGSLFAQICARILTDESRHQAFAEQYLKKAVGHNAAIRATLVQMRDELLFLMEVMYQRLKKDAEILSIDGAHFFAELGNDLDKKVHKLQLAAPEEDGEG